MATTTKKRSKATNDRLAHLTLRIYQSQLDRVASLRHSIGFGTVADVIRRCIDVGLDAAEKNVAVLKNKGRRA